ncbi:MAG: cobalamin B12-binding domain-containing protein, partial [Cyclobacteriaceae bacterium]
MKVFLVYVRDEDFYHILPERLNKNKDDGKLKVMAFPPLGIQTLAPVLRKHGHEVRMFDTCHPEMKQENIAIALSAEKPDVIALSFLSTTSYRLLKSMAKRLK